MKWDEHFYYDETSPSCLRWNKTICAGKYRTVVNVHKGSCAGTLSNGYYFITLNGRSIGSHRIVWELFNGKIPDNMFIDHIDTNRTNNKLCNLRIVTKQQNAQNRTVQKNNKSGMQGVNLRVNGYGTEYWEASWQENGKTKCKCYSVKKFGFEHAEALAIKYRNNMIDKLNNEGMLYSELHKIKE